MGWFADHAADYDADVHDRLADYAMLAVQGPKARQIVGSMAQGDLPARHRIADMNLGPGDALVCGTGYTGEDGVEILVKPDAAAALWEELVIAGAKPGRPGRPRHPAPGGQLLPLRQRADRGADPDRGGPGLGAGRRHRLHR